MQEREEARRKPMLIRIYDGDWHLRGPVEGYISAEFTWRYNEIGTGIVVLPVDHYLARWAVDYHSRRTQNIHIVCDKNGARWSGRVQQIEYQYDAEGSPVVVLTALDDIAELDYIYGWANPFLPDAVQFPKAMVAAVPCEYGCRMYLLANLMRLQGNLWKLPDEPLDPRQWVNGLRPWDWPILVKPKPMLLDSSKIELFSSRFTKLLDLFRGPCADAGIMITYRRWLTGDPPPWPGCLVNRNGQLVFDFVDKSGVFDGTARGGNIVDGIIRTITSIADNGVDEVLNDLLEPYEPFQNTVSKLLGTDPKCPHVTYIVGGMPGVVSASYGWTPATAAQVLTGGHSTYGVNETISLSLKLVGNILGAIFTFGTAGDILDTAVKPLYEDVFLAFTTIKSPLRTMRSGWSHYQEFWADGSDRAYSFSALNAIRLGFFATASKTSHAIDVADGAPWVIGDNGMGHFFLGDRIGVVYQDFDTRRSNIEQVQQISLKADRDTEDVFTITVGDPSLHEPPLNRVFRETKKIDTALAMLGVR